MQRRLTPADPCLWAGQRLSLRLDGEISEFEEARLEEHLRSCADCRALAGELEGLTETLRATPLEEPGIAFRPPRRRYVGAYAVRAVSATAAVAVMAVSGLVGLTGIVAPKVSTNATAAADVRVARERIAVKEQLLDRLENTARARAPQIRPSLAGVEQVTVGGPRVSTTVSSANEGR